MDYILKSKTKYNEGRDKTGEGNQEVPTTKYKIGKHQGCNVQHREYIQYFIKLNMKYDL